MKPILSGRNLLAHFAVTVSLLNNAEAGLSLMNLGHYLATDETLFEQGVFRGKIVDQSIKRPVTLVNELETLKNYYATNVLNQGQFWMAEIPHRAVDKVIFQLALFKTPIGLTLAHGQLRFQFHKPVGLYRLKGQEIVQTQTKDLIFTIQAALPKGESYNVVDAVSGNYKVVSRLVNTFDRVYKEEVPDGDIVTQYKLVNLTFEQKDLLLKNMLKFSTDNLLSKTYYATNANCINLLVDVIDQTLGLKHPRIELNFENMVTNGSSPNEKITLEALKERNLINETSPMIDYTLERKLKSR